MLPSVCLLWFKRKVGRGYLRTHVPLFLSKVVLFYFVPHEAEQAHLAGNLMAKILKDNHSNQEFLNHQEDVWGHS